MANVQAIQNPTHKRENRQCSSDQPEVEIRSVHPLYIYLSKKLAYVGKYWYPQHV
jgi:hypothetical protein